MNYSQFRTSLLRRIRNSGLTVQAAEWLNDAANELAGMARWKHFETRCILPTTAPYTTGTVAVTNGSTTVTGTGTAWTSAMVGQLWQGPDDRYYVISAVASTTSMTLTSAYVGSTASSQTYSIYFYQLDLPATMAFPDAADFNIQDGTGQGWPLTFMHNQILLDQVPNELYAPGRPRNWRNFGGTKIQLWPVPDAAYNVNGFFIKTPEMALLAAGGDQTTNEASSTLIEQWPEPLQYALLALAEAEGWRYLNDAREDRARARGRGLASEWVLKNNQMPTDGMAMQRWDVNGASGFYPPQPPGSITGS